MNYADVDYSIKELPDLYSHYKEIKVLQIGCGGTGSYLMPPLYKYLSSISKNGACEVIYYLIDHDVVEDKNCWRQNFTTNMINARKNVALKSIYQFPNDKIIRNYNIAITEDTIDLYEDLMVSNRPTITIVIGCVDNIEARKQILSLCNRICIKKLINLNESMLWYIDSGNYISSGQSIVLNYKDDDSIVTNTNIMKELFFDNKAAIKMDTDLPSCTINGDQSIFANFRAADIIYSIVSEILSRGTTTVSKISFLRYQLDASMDTMNQLEHGFL